MNAVVKSDSSSGCKVYRYKLSTGGYCYILPCRNDSLNCAAVVVNAGSAENHAFVNGEKITFPTGTAHFLEHKMFEKENGDMMAEFSSLGANVNAFTDMSRTVYYFSARGNFEKALEKLVIMVYSPYFCEETIENEKKIITREMAMYKDNPSWNAYFSMLGCLYNKNRRFLQPCGNKREVGKINSSTLYKFYNCFYTGDNISFVVCTSLDPMMCAEIIEKNIIVRNSGEIYFEYEKYKKPVRCIAEQRGSVNMPVHSMGFRLERLRTDVKNICAVNMLFEMAAGKSSPLADKLIEKEISSFIPSLSQCFGRGFYFAAADCSGFGGEKIVKLMEKAFENIYHNGIDEQRLAHTKKVMEENIISLLHSAESTMFLQSYIAAAKGDVTDMLSVIRGMEKEYLYEALKRSFVNNVSVFSSFGV